LHYITWLGQRASRPIGGARGCIARSLQGGLEAVPHGLARTTGSTTPSAARRRSTRPERLSTALLETLAPLGPELELLAFEHGLDATPDHSVVTNDWQAGDAYVRLRSTRLFLSAQHHGALRALHEAAKSLDLLVE